MNFVDERGERVVVERPAEPLLSRIDKEYAGTDKKRWKHVAMFYLRHFCGFTETQISWAFHDHRGNVNRVLDQTAQRIKEALTQSGDEPGQRLLFGES